MTKDHFVKLYRFFKLYGFVRTYVKAAGRLRSKYVITLPVTLIKRQKNVAIIGCGQFSFATIGVFLRSEQGAIIKKCFDIDADNSLSFSKYYNVQSVNSIHEIMDDPNITLVYIASNHASHTDYAIKAIEKGKNVYIEKPVSTNFEQFELLKRVVSEKKSHVYVGYNRPFSKAITELKKHLPLTRTPLTFNCFVLGHVIPPEHWYRRPEEGTRVCGNLGHWIDLAIHILSIYEMSKSFDIQIAYSNIQESDDNITVVITTEYYDLITLTLTSRSEPFEGINETINVQIGNVIAKIDDFRKIDIWHNSKHIRKKYFRKDVGHKRAILQPFTNDKRNWEEIKLSTQLMLFISDMVINRIVKSKFVRK